MKTTEQIISDLIYIHGNERSVIAYLLGSLERNERQLNAVRKSLYIKSEDTIIDYLQKYRRGV